MGGRKDLGSTKEEQIKKKQTLDAKKQENKEKQMQLKEMKAEIVKKEFQDNLKEHLEQKLNDVINKLQTTEKGEKLSIVELKTMLAQKNQNGLSPKYSTTELAIIIDYYKQFITEINKVQKYIPSIPNFCGFAGITTSQYNNWKISEDEERRELIQRIDDYIADIMLTLAQEGEIKEVTTIFRAHAEHKMVEPTAPITIQHKSDLNMDDIMAQIKAVNEGKSLKTIELKECKDGVFREKEEK